MCMHRNGFRKNHNGPVSDNSSWQSTLDCSRYPKATVENIPLPISIQSKFRATERTRTRTPYSSFKAITSHPSCHSDHANSGPRDRKRDVVKLERGASPLHWLHETFDHRQSHALSGSAHLGSNMRAPDWGKYRGRGEEKEGEEWYVKADNDQWCHNTITSTWAPLRTHPLTHKRHSSVIFARQTFEDGGFC